jgi:hypothetical protein
MRICQPPVNNVCEVRKIFEELPVLGADQRTKSFANSLRWLVLGRDGFAMKHCGCEFPFDLFWPAGRSPP